MSGQTSVSLDFKFGHNRVRTFVWTDKVTTCKAAGNCEKLQWMFLLQSRDAVRNQNPVVCKQILLSDPSDVYRGWSANITYQLAKMD